MIQKKLFTKMLLVAAMLGVGTSAWADVYTNDSYRYDVVFGTPTYTAEVLTGIGVQTDFTSDKSELEASTMTMVMTGSVLSGNQAGGKTYSFSNPQTAGTVVFKALGKFVGGGYTFFNIYGVKEQGGETTDNYAIIQSPTNLPNASGETTVLRIFGQDIKASYVYVPRNQVYGFDVTIDLENQKVDYVVTYASKGGSGSVTQLGTVEGSVSVPDGIVLKSVKSLNLPRIGSAGGNYYDNVAFYGTAPATTYTLNYKDDNNVLLKSVVCDSYAGMTASASDAQLENFTKDATEYTYKSGNDPITLSATAASNVINLLFKAATTPTTYTFRYLDGNGDAIKVAYVADAYAGDVVTASGETLPTYIWYESKKYKYSSGNDNLTLTANAEDNVIELVYAEAPKYTYTIKASTGQTITSASNYENETITYYWPSVLNVDGTLYTSSSVGSGEYKSTLTLDEDKNVTVTFTESSTTGLVYLAEGEDIFTRGTGANADIRLSMGAGGYAIEKTDIVNLPAGVYTLCGVNRGNSSGQSNHTFYMGDEVIYTTSPQGYNVAFSVPFVLTTATTISMQGGGEGRLIDHVYIYNHAEQNVTISAAGMATYVPAYNLDFTGTDIAAYTAEVTSQGVCMLTGIKKVPAGTPVLLVGTTDNIPVSATTDAVGTNNLVAGTGDAVETTDGEYTNMILNKVGDNVGFYFAAGQTVAADRAYLHIATSLAPNPSSGAPMMMVFADDMQTTGVNDVKRETITNNTYYNLNGQRVAQPTKGLYIVNGKKAIVK